MKNVISYVEKYGDMTFKEKSIGEIDYAILSILSYLNYDGILYPDNVKMKLNDALTKFFFKYSKKELKTHGFGVRDAYKIAEALLDTKRYKDLKLYNYVYNIDDALQFSAMFIDIDEDTIFISIEGTDDEIEAWREDFQLSYQFPIPSQRKCINYLNKHIRLLTEKKFIIGGHSKGGNLALVGAMFLNPLKQNKIKAIYSFDGPGLNDREIKSYRYLSIKKKYHLIMSNYAIVGLLFNYSNDYKIVSSYKKGLMAHSIYNWRVFDDKFYEVDELSNMSKSIDSSIKKWLNNYDIKTLRLFVEDIFDIFDRCNITNLYKIHARNLKEIRTVVRETNNISPETKSIIMDFIKTLLTTIKDDTFPILKSKKE